MLLDRRQSYADFGCPRLTCFLRCTLFAFALLSANVAASEATWTVNHISLTPESKLTGQLTVELSRGGSTIEITSEVRLTSVNDHFVYHDRLVVTGKVGEQAQASGVVIFDLASRKRLDWFVCWEAVRISESWIASVEWYPEHGMRWPTDVVLIYDLDKSPSQNRLGSATSPASPSSVQDTSVTAGFPVYPHTNAVEASYANVVSDAESSVRVLGAPYFVLLPSRWLVFVAAQGTDYPSSRNHLVVVDLSHGLLRPPAWIVEIPREGFRNAGRNPGMIQTDRIEPVREDSVRHFLPESEYGISSEVVNLAAGARQ